jgi:hypothetical protein
VLYVVYFERSEAKIDDPSQLIFIFAAEHANIEVCENHVDETE